MIVAFLIVSACLIIMMAFCSFLAFDRRRLRREYDDFVQRTKNHVKGERRELKEALTNEQFENNLLKERMEKQETLLAGYRSLLTETHAVLLGSVKKDYKTLLREVRGLLIQLVEFAKHDDMQEEEPVNERKKQDFVRRLMSMYPEVTESSSHLAYLIAIDTPVSTISQVMGINAKSVQMARFRLRKRMGLLESDSLEEALRQLVE